MSGRLAMAAVLALLGTPVGAQSGEAPSTRFVPRDLFGLEVATDPRISPDGRHVAYVRRQNDLLTDRAVPSIWLIDTRTGEHMPLVAGPGSHGSPRWSPDGRRLAYISASEGGAAQLFVRWIDGGATARVTNLPDTPGALSWSPDGKRIAYTLFVPDEGPKLGAPEPKPEGAKWAEPLQITEQVTFRSDGRGVLKPGYSKIFVVPAEGGAARQLTSGKFHDEGPLSWSPDGRTIYFSADRTPGWERNAQESEVHALDVASGAIRTLTSRKGPDGEPVVSPDGQRIAYTGFDDRGFGYHNVVLYVMDRDGSNPRALTTALDRSIERPVWAADGRSVYVSYADRGAVKVARVGLDGTVRTVADGLTGAALDRPYSGGEFSVATDGAVAFTGGDASAPADIGLVRGGERRMLTRLNDSMRAGKRMGEVRRVSAKSSHDGREIEAWLTLPPGYAAGTRVPLILEIHGGPHAAYGPHFSTDNQLYAAEGYAVLSVNPRGSTSYGAEFANLIHYKYPGNDYDDLISAVDGVIASGVADPDRLFVTGGSGGGVLTSWIVGKTNRFKAAATQKPVVNMTSQVLVADNPAYFSRYWFGKFPWEDPQAYWARSPLSLVGNVRTPTLVVVGSEDYRTPVSEAEQYYTALQLRGVPTALIKVPGASHGGLAARPSQSGAKARAILAWFKRYERGAPAPAAAVASAAE
jgi:dipeptidyl aminopeptidase/acylaminoacyl peptidase